MCILLTSASGGNVATALCNTVISNLAGIALTPVLLLRFFGKGIELPFGELVGKLCNKVLVPVAVGQALRATPVKDFYSEHTSFFKRLQEVREMNEGARGFKRFLCMSHVLNQCIIYISDGAPRHSMECILQRLHTRIRPRTKPRHCPPDTPSLTPHWIVGNALCSISIQTLFR